jgi:hypothetical protein
MNLLQQQTLGWVGLWQGMATGTLDRRDLARDVADIWAASFQSVLGLMTFPSEWSARRLMSTPSLVFMVDGWSQTVGPESAPTAITVPDGALVASTVLQKINGGAVIDASHVQVSMVSRGNRVEVSLVNLGNSANAPGNVLEAGSYVGVAFAIEGPNRRPLALIYVNVDRTNAPNVPR